MTTSPPAAVPPARSTAGAALLVSADERLTSDVMRLAAAAGAPLEVVADPAAALGGWGTAAAVLVGTDLLAVVAAHRPPRRADVHVVAQGAAPDFLFRDALDVGAASVVELPDAEQWLVSALTDLVDEAAVTGATTVAVVGGAGGVGATVLAVSLGLVAAREGEATVLVDLDPWGPGLARVAGIDVRPAVTWRELALSPGRFGARSLREALATPDGVGVLGWDDAPGGPPSAATVREVLSAARRGHSWVVVDLPHRDGGLVAEVLPHCDAVLLVGAATLGSVAATARVAGRLRDHGADPGLVVRTRRGGLEPEELAEAVALPLLARLPDQRRLDEHLDLGAGPVHARRGVLSRTAEVLLERCREMR
ncbi:septum site-determining protein Ssd [Nocardioides caldifontis]|uniref:septum site-determining protein Ssd n=1 Tax=Nocardioides caldifontis TaxID=2588938 RepID=UPI0011E06BB4|nr:septum site-determining protein Ssd [Nocardioides caldifontis]